MLNRFGGWMKKILIGMVCLILAACTGGVTPTSSPILPTKNPTVIPILPPPEKTPTLPPNENGDNLGECKPDYLQGDFSPDANWFICQTPFDIYFRNQDGKEVGFNPPGITKNNQMYWFSPIRWSGDSKFLWVGASGTTGGSSFCDIGQPYLGLFRIDIESGFTTATLPMNLDQYYLLFSPSGSHLAFIQGRSKLTVMNIISGGIKEYSDSQTLSGSLLYSPDESYLAFSTQEMSREFGCINSTLKILDIKSGDVEPYFNDPKIAPIILNDWDTSDLISFNLYPATFGKLDFRNRKIELNQP
jgi:hypothetical protein